MYSPMLKGENRKKRKSRNDFEDTVSEHITESPQKMTLHTSDTFVRIPYSKKDTKISNSAKS